MSDTENIGRDEYTKEMGDLICDLISEGNSLRSVCNDESLPDKRTVFRWLRTHEDFCHQYARACEERTEAMAEDILDIADDGSNDLMTVKKGNLTYKVEDKEVTNRSKLRVETRKWIMSKMKPKKYGDKLDLTSDGKRIENAPVIISEIKPRNADPEPEATESS